MARERILLNKEMIVEKAWELIDADGPEAMSARKISAALKVSPMMLYRHVENIDAITKEIMIKGFTIMNRDIDRRLQEIVKGPGTRKAEDIFEIIADEVFDFAIAHKDIYILMFNVDGTKFRDDPDLLKLYRGVGITMEAFFGSEFVKKNKMAIYVFEVFLNGLIVEKVRNRVDLDKEEFKEYVRFCIEGLLCR